MSKPGKELLMSVAVNCTGPGLCPAIDSVHPSEPERRTAATPDPGGWHLQRHDAQTPDSDLEEEFEDDTDDTTDGHIFEDDTDEEWDDDDDDEDDDEDYEETDDDMNDEADDYDADEEEDW